VLPVRQVRDEERAGAGLPRDRVGCPGRPERGLEPRRGDLEQPLLGMKPLQPMQAEIGEDDPDQIRVLDHSGGGVRHQELAAAAGGADTRGASDADADVPVLAEQRLRGVEANSHPHSGTLRPLEPAQRQLTLDRGGDGIPRALERNEESVACRVDLVPTVGAERLAEQAAMVAPNRGESLVPEAPDEFRGLLDVAEEEGHGSARERSAFHSRRILAAVRRSR
jgi:hypothetical protein